MTPNAIAKLRRTFIAVATASFFIVIVLVGMAASLANVVAIAGDANRTIDAIIDARGGTPSQENFADGVFHEEASYGLRFFTVSYDMAGNVSNVDLSHVVSVSPYRAIEMAEVAADPKTLTGLNRYGDYLYKEGAIEGGSMVAFLDCSIQISNAWTTIIHTLVICVVAVIITFICVLVISNWAIRPEVENARQQQQFMTNASHELKTPIAVIRANTELTEMMSGETEWTQSTLRQVDRLERLVSNLMTIVRGEERAESAALAGDGSGADGATGIADVDATQVVGAAVESFKSVAQQSGLELAADIEQGVTVRGKAESVEQLACLLVDNAIKYCDTDGSVSVSLSKARVGRGCVLTVSNDYAAGHDVDYRRFFERFYREDESHENQQGYGIGLSVAESICKRYRGSIKATWKSGVITFTCILRGV